MLEGCRGLRPSVPGQFLGFERLVLEMHELPAPCRGAQQLWAPLRCDGGAPSLGPGSARPAVNLWLLTAALPPGLRGVGSLILTLLQRSCGGAQPGGCGGGKDEHPLVPPDGMMVPDPHPVLCWSGPGDAAGR